MRGNRSSVIDPIFQKGIEVKLVRDVQVEGEGIPGQARHGNLKGVITSVEGQQGEDTKVYVKFNDRDPVLLDVGDVISQEEVNCAGAAYSLGDRRRHLHFWSTLSEGNKKYFARASEEIPLDLMAGLMNPGKKLFQKRSTQAWLSFLITVARIILNLVSSADLCLKGWHSGDVVFGAAWTQSYTELKKEAVVMCETNFKASIQNSSKFVDMDCIEADLSRLNALKFIAAFEFATLVGMTLVLCIVWFLYLCGCDCLLAQFPGIFLIFPKLASKFSSICFLQLFNVSRLKSLILQGEWKLVFTTMKHGMFFNSDKGAEISTFQDSGFGDQSWGNCLGVVVIGVLGLMYCLGTIGLALQALLVKMTAIHFASVRSWDTWNRYEWLLVFAFLNQIAGLAFVDEVEVHRVLLFKFGGHSTSWGWNRAAECVAYMRLLTMRIADGWISQQECCGSKIQWLNRIKVLALLTTLDSTSLQLLLQSPERENYMIWSREDRFKLFDSLYQKSGADESEDVPSRLSTTAPEGYSELEQRDYDQTFLSERLEVLQREFKKKMIIEDDGRPTIEKADVLSLPAEKLMAAAQLQAQIEHLHLMQAKKHS